MRKQAVHVRTGAPKRIILMVMAVIAGLILIALAYWAFNRPYVHPPFEKLAQIGTPTVEESLGYGDVSAEGGFHFMVASTMYQQPDSSLIVYLTNPENSGIMLMCQVKDETGRLLYESGVLRPGEYVERLQPERALENVPTPIEMIVYAFEPDTWYSKGTISLQNMLQPN